MQFRGLTKRDRQYSEGAWFTWCRTIENKPWLREFAERWADLMELQFAPRVYVRQVAAKTMQELRQQRKFQKVTQLQVREVILILRRTWTYGSSLYDWGRDQGFLNPDD